MKYFLKLYHFSSCISFARTITYNRRWELALFSIFLFFNINNAHCAQLENKNYFASLRASETNVRSGPSINHPIKFTFKLRSIPVKIIGKYDNWNEIRDFDGETGWVNRNLLTKKRTIIVKTKKKFINLYAAANKKSKTILRLENNVIGSLIECHNDWCFVKVNSKKGWLEKKGIWGV